MKNASTEAPLRRPAFAGRVCKARGCGRACYPRLVEGQHEYCLMHLFMLDENIPEQAAPRDN